MIQFWYPNADAIQIEFCSPVGDGLIYFIILKIVWPRSGRAANPPAVPDSTISSKRTLTSSSKKIEKAEQRGCSQGYALIKTESTALWVFHYFGENDFRVLFTNDSPQKCTTIINFFSKRLESPMLIARCRWQDKRLWWARNNLENERRRFRVFRNESSASSNKIAVLFSTTTRRVPLHHSCSTHTYRRKHIRTHAKYNEDSEAPRWLSLFLERHWISL